MVSVDTLRHPYYLTNEQNWFKWRLTMLGGAEFRDQYLARYGKRETDSDFSDRKRITYVPAFAKKEVNRVKNSIFKRLNEVVRAGGPDSYQKGCTGEDIGGVDLQGSTMDGFIGKYVLPELLSMTRVGVYVDMPQLEGPTIAQKLGKRPYLYHYKAEDIRSWAPVRHGDPTEFQALLLQDSDYDMDGTWRLPGGMRTRYRYLYLDPERDGKVTVVFYDKVEDEKGKTSWNGEKPIYLEIRKIPFVVFTISNSLLDDAADYQIALMNIASTDVEYARKSNFPFYVEQFDWKTDSPHLKTGNMQTFTSTNFDPNTLAMLVTQETGREIQIGGSGGRQYPKGTERPAFIHPSSEPLNVAMAKEEQMKREIAELVSNALSSLTPSRTEEETPDEEGASAGLHYISMELQQGERKIAEIWSLYEGSKTATIRYPKNYCLMSEEAKRDRAEFLKGLMTHVPSSTFQHELAKQIAEESIGDRIDDPTLTKIKREIDTAAIVYVDSEIISSDIELGLVSLETASRARGYPEGEVEQAKKDHAERIARIAAAQTPGQGYGAMDARGVADQGANPAAGREEKQESQKEQSKEPVPHDKTRGPNA